PGGAEGLLTGTPGTAEAGGDAPAFVVDPAVVSCPGELAELVPLLMLLEARLAAAVLALPAGAGTPSWTAPLGVLSATDPGLLPSECPTEGAGASSPDDRRLPPTALGSAVPPM